MNSNRRVADMTVKLMAGHAVSFSQAEEVSLRTFQRDLATIRTALADQSAGKLVETQDHQWYLTHADESDSLALITCVSSILLGSRALSSAEMTKALAFLQAQLSQEDAEAVNHWLKQEKADYLPLVHAKPLLSLLPQLEEAVSANQLLTFKYQHSGKAHLSVIQGQPVTVYFDRFYFYAAMFVAKKDRYQLFRLDRIKDIIKKSKGQKLSHVGRYSLSEHRRHSYLLDMGEFMAFRYVCYNSPDNALDVFPDSRVVCKQTDGSTIIESYAFVFGAMLWLRSQGPLVRVISPPSLVKQMKETLTLASRRYENS